MIIEWLGGPHDGHRFEVPDSTDFIKVVRQAGRLTWPSEGVELEDIYAENDTVLIEIVKRRNQIGLAQWKEL